jgi:2-polyprenyl-3-methyl-5-hydroxy-6-metoxy-1,4-benzoquinol methylase
MHAHDHDHDLENLHRHVHGNDDERMMPGSVLWATNYAEHIQRYEWVASHMPPGANVLDAGCGVGYGSAHLADRGARHVTAVDLAEEALAVARRQFTRPNLEFIREDCETLAAAGRRGPFDLIANLENIEHLPHPERFLTRIVELLAPGGVFVTSTPEKAGMARLRGLPVELAPANPHHTYEFTSEEFRRFLLRKFTHVELAWQGYDPLDRMTWEPVLHALWTNPFARAGRWLQRVVRRRPVPPSLESLLPPRRYQLLAHDPGPGMAITVLAVCRGPRAGA